MDKAVLCIAHKDPEQINDLLKQLLSDANGRTDIYLHLDKKSEDIGKAIIKDSHVFFIQNNHSITWGNDSNVRMLVDCFREITDTGRKYDYFQICTGQDLVVRPGLDRYLEENNGKIFISTWKDDKYIKNLLLHKYPKCFQKDVSRNNFMRYLELAYFYFIRTGLVPKKKINYDISTIDFWVSYNWCLMPYEVLQYINSFISENPGFMTIFYNARVPEDGFLGTILQNSPYRDRIEYFDGTLKGNSLTFMKKMDGCHPPVLRMSDKETIDKSNCYLARKFDIKTDKEIIDYYTDKIINGKE